MNEKASHVEAFFVVTCKQRKSYQTRTPKPARNSFW